MIYLVFLNLINIQILVAFVTVSYAALTYIILACENLM